MTHITQEEIRALFAPAPQAKPKRRNKRIESGLVSNAIKWLFAHGCFVWRNNTGSYKVDSRYIRYGLKGSADIIGVTSYGRLIAVECKTGKNGLTLEQELFGHRITDKGGLFIAAWSLDDLESRKDEVTGSIFLTKV